MTSEQASAANGVSSAADLEKQLAVTLLEASDDLSRAECLDSEQRAEVYTILKTLIADTDLHCRLVGEWTREHPGGTANA